MVTTLLYWPVAQPGEHSTFNRVVGSSNLLRPTNIGVYGFWDFVHTRKRSKIKRMASWQSMV